MVVSQDFLDQQFSAGMQGTHTPHEPFSTSCSDQRQFVSILGRAGDPTSKRRVWERTMAPGGVATAWVEVPDESRPFE